MLKSDKSNKMTWKDDDDKNFYLPLLAKDKKGIIKHCGETRFQIDICPIDYATKNKVGSARDNPNMNPYLPPPIGRISFTLNPWKLFQEMVGPEMRRKIYKYCCLITCCALCSFLFVFMFPIVIGDIVANAFWGSQEIYTM